MPGSTVALNRRELLQAATMIPAVAAARSAAFDADFGSAQAAAAAIHTRWISAEERTRRVLQRTERPPRLLRRLPKRSAASIRPRAPVRHKTESRNPREHLSRYGLDLQAGDARKIGGVPRQERRSQRG